ncbi:MAG: formate dehydrogenase subunit alpha [Nitrospira sp.]|jgi:formate dehydrogenase major subunit|nr:formate dehydrogenase subunit alpha [Nitrospira sp.]
MKNESELRSPSSGLVPRAARLSEVALTIDGRRVTAMEGDTVFTAAKRAGVAMPGLCASDHLKPFGSCRLCVCEVEGQKGTPASCTTPVQDGMVVRTQTDRLTQLRRNVVELLLSEQPADGTLSPAVQALAQSVGLERVRYRQPAVRADVQDRSNPFFVFDNTICISCARCVRACDEIQGTNALTMLGRGFESRPAAGGAGLSAIGHEPSAEGFAESNCVSCGACVKECPTGALVEKRRVQLGSPTQVVRTTCAYCGVGCAFDAGVRDGEVVTMVPADDGPANEGHACMKGRFGWTYIDAPDRLTMPLLRNGHEWQKISWEAALDRIAQEFTRIKTEQGPDALAVVSSSRGTNEENYLFGKFIRCVMGTNHIDNCARVCHSATVTGMMETLGASAATNSIEDLDQAQLIMVVGANPTESHPVVGARIKRAHRRGVPLIVIDPRRTELARLATLHLALRPGTNVALLNGMAHVMAKEGLLDRQFIESRTEGIDEWLKTVEPCTPEWAEQITGVSADLIREAARRYAASGASLCVHGLGMTEHRWGTHGVIALVDLALATGNIGRPGTGINPLRGQNNVQGASDVGCLPTYFAGYQPLDDPTLGALHQQVTGRPLPTKRGMKTPDMWDAALAGRLQGLWIIGYDVAQTDPNLKKVHEALRRVGFLVVQDLFLSETAKFAHLVLPGASFLEKDGTFTNLERRIQRIRKAVDPPNGILPDWQVVCEVATRMGYPMAYRHPSEIMEEIARLTPMFAGVSYDRLESPSGVQWPVPASGHAGTALMHRETFPKGRAQFVGVDYLPPGESPTEEYPFTLVTGRILQHYNCGAQTRRTDILKVVDGDALEMHPDDAARLGMADGDLVRLVSPRGSAVLPLVVSERVQAGQLFTSFHFPASEVNVLLSSSADERSQCPEYKVSVVRVAPFDREELDAEDESELAAVHIRLIS